MTTLTRSVSGEQQNFSGNMENLPGIGRLEKLSGKHEIISGHCMKKRDKKLLSLKEGQTKLRQKGDPFARHAFQ